MSKADKKARNKRADVRYEKRFWKAEQEKQKNRDAPFNRRNAKQ